MKFIELNYNFCPSYTFLSDEIFSFELAEHYQKKKKVKIGKNKLKLTKNK
jgi:hypothetical protein